MLSDSEPNGQPCGNPNCSTSVGDESGIQCDFCNRWFHLSCTELDEVSYKFLSETKFDSIIWKCSSCPSLKNLVNGNISVYMSEFEKLISGKIDSIETNIAKKINLAYKFRDSVLSEQPTSTSNNDEIDRSVIVTDVIDNSQHSKEKEAEDQLPLVIDDVPAAPTTITQICGHYKKGVCRHGASGKKLVNNAGCKFLHPPKCKKFCKFGRDGCEGGCGMLHPILCKSSLKFRECFNDSCTLAHLVGTRRHQTQVQNRPSNRPQSNIPYIDHGVQMSSQRYGEAFLPSKNYFASTHRKNQGSGYTYVRDEFPPLTSAQNNMSAIASSIQQLQSSVDFLMRSTQYSKPDLTMNRKHLNQYSDDQLNNTVQPTHQPSPVNQHFHNAKNYHLQRQGFIG